MSLSRKHYQAVADILARARSRKPERNPNVVIDRITRDFVEYFHSDNPRFDSRRFIEACHIGPRDPEPSLEDEIREAYRDGDDARLAKLQQELLSSIVRD